MKNIFLLGQLLNSVVVFIQFTRPKMMAGILEACMVVTTDIGITGESRTANRPK